MLSLVHLTFKNPYWNTSRFYWFVKHLKYAQVGKKTDPYKIISSGLFKLIGLLCLVFVLEHILFLHSFKILHSV